MSAPKVPFYPMTHEDAVRMTNAIIAMATPGASEDALDEMFSAMIDGENTTSLFRHWWPLARKQDIDAAALQEGASDAGTVANRYHTLTRWFTLLGKAWAGKYYTLRGPDYRVNSTGVTSITPMGDLAGRMAAACATEESGLDPDWADEDPTTWYLRFNGLSLADGTMNVLAVEGVDQAFDITGNIAPVYTGRLGLFKLHYTDGVYEYKTFTTQPEGAFKTWAGDVAPDKTHRPMNWEATFPGSKHGTKLTSGSGYDGLSWERNSNTPAWRVSAADGLSAARNWDSYEGVYSDTDLEPILDLWQLRHFDLENSGIIEGCLNYNYQYVVSAAEEGVTSVLLTPAQAANLVIGGCVEVGSHPEGTNNDRDTAANYDLISFANILRMEDVTIDGTALTRVPLDIPAAINVPATAYVSTMPWVPGSTEHLPGHKDGSLANCTNGRTPARIAGVEIIDGAYVVGLDPLWMSDWDETRDPKSMYTVHQCRDSEKQAGSITSDYEEVGTFTSAASGWQYEKHLAINDKGMIYPDALGAASTTFMKSAFYFRASSGVRAPWRFYALNSGGYGGLAGANGSVTPGYADWDERPRLSGSGKKRGEWAA
jgi:hypothetical protein